MTLASGVQAAGNLSPWEMAHAISSTLVDCSLLIGAIVAIVKFRLFNLLGHRWRSDLNCRHYALPSGKIVFVAEYIVSNSGQRPLRLTEVTIQLVRAKRENGILVPAEDRVIARRLLLSTTSAVSGLFDIQSAERSIFTLRTQLDDLDDVVFIICEFKIAHRREPTRYRGFYCRYGLPAQKRYEPDEQ